MRLKFGEIPDDVRRRIEQADTDTILTWTERILTAERIDDIFRRARIGPWATLQ
jgi:hypothetical protein